MAAEGFALGANGNFQRRYSPEILAYMASNGYAPRDGGGFQLIDFKPQAVENGGTIFGAIIESSGQIVDDPGTVEVGAIIEKNRHYIPGARMSQEDYRQRFALGPNTHES
jgi:hypothetical protein